MKKLFNNNVMRVVLALGMFAFAGCVDNKIDSQPSAAPNIQDDAQLSYDMAAESAPNAVFNISANTPWRISSDSQWCKVTPSMSAVGGLVSEVYISVEDNEDYAPRTAVLTISGVELEYTKTISVVQASKTDFIVTEFGGTIPAEGGVATYRIHTNKKWEYFAVDDYLYGVTNITSGEDTDEAVDYELNIDVPANPGVVRTGRFIIRTAAGDYEYSIAQKGITLTLDEEQEETFAFVYSPGTSHTYTVDTNITGWWAEPYETDWITVSAHESEGDDDPSTVTVTTTGYNSIFVPRKGYFVLKAADGVESLPFEITQDSAFSNPNTAIWDIDEEDGSVTISIGKSVGTPALRTKDSYLAAGTFTFEIDTDASVMKDGHYRFSWAQVVGDNNGFFVALATHAPCIVNGPANGGASNCYMQVGGLNYQLDASYGNNRFNFDGFGGGGIQDPDCKFNHEAVQKMKTVKLSKICEGTTAGSKVTLSFTLITSDGETYTCSKNGTLSYDLGKVTSSYPNEFAAFAFVNPNANNGTGADGKHPHLAGYDGDHIKFKSITFEPQVFE